MKCLYLFLNCSPPTFCSPFIPFSISTFSSPLSIRSATPSASRFALLIPHYDPLFVRPTIARTLIARSDAESSTERVRPCVRNSGKSFSLPNKIFRGKARAAGQLSSTTSRKTTAVRRERSAGVHASSTAARFRKSKGNSMP